MLTLTDIHFAHLKDQANTGMISKEAKMCPTCREGRALLKGKYRAAKGGGSTGKSGTRTNNKQPRSGLASLMSHPVAIKLHYEECLANGWYEQLPEGLRPKS